MHEYDKFSNLYSQLIIEGKTKKKKKSSLASFHTGVRKSFINTTTIVRRSKYNSKQNNLTTVEGKVNGKPLSSSCLKPIIGLEGLGIPP